MFIFQIIELKYLEESLTLLFVNLLIIGGFDYIYFYFNTSYDLVRHITLVILILKLTQLFLSYIIYFLPLKLLSFLSYPSLISLF